MAETGVTPEEYWELLADWEKELLGEPAGVFDREAIQAIIDYASSPRACCGRPIGDKLTALEQRPCAYGNCVELFCPCGAPDGSGWGPTDCPCQAEEPEVTGG